MSVPRISASCAAYRKVEVSTDPSKRSISSTARGMSAGSLRSSAAWSGCSSRFRTELPIW